MKKRKTIQPAASGQRPGAPARGRDILLRARPSVVGWISSIVVFLLIPVVLMAGLHAKPLGTNLARVLVWPSLALPLIAGFFLFIFPTMRYVVGNGEIKLICGPFRWTIPVSEVRNIVEKDLVYLPWSEGWKLPGYALFSMRFAKVGKVRMCATTLTHRVLLIETGKETWGISPSSVPLFLAAVKREQEHR
jgi:hypothetical protein